MKKLLLILALLFAPTLTSAQCTGVFPAGSVCGSLTQGTPHQVPFTSFVGTTPLAQYHFFIGNASGVATDTPLSGDCVYGALGIVCTKTNGVAFGVFATGTDAANLTGTLNCGRLPAFTGDVTKASGSCATVLPNIVTAGTFGDATHVPRVTVNAKGQVTAVSSVSITTGAPGACGWRQNMIMSPGTITGASETTYKTLTGPAYFLLCNGLSWITSPATNYSSGQVLVTTIGQGGTGNGTGLVSINVTSRNGAGCTSPCVSVTALQGGLDPGDPAGATLQANTLYNIFMVARDPSNAPDDWGLVFSSRICTEGPSATVQVVYPYYSCIDWFWSNGAANAMQWMTVKQDHVWNFAGGAGTGAGGTATMPQIASNTAAQWTGVFTNPSSITYGSSDNTGTFTFALGVLGAGDFVRIAPNIHFGNFTPCGQVGAGAAVYGFQMCTMTPDAGALGYWSTGTTSLVYLFGGLDGF